MNSNRKLNLLKLGQSSVLLASLILPAIIKPLETKARFTFSTFNKNTRVGRTSNQSSNALFTVTNWRGPNNTIVGNIKYNPTNETDWYSNYQAEGIPRLQPGPHNALVPYVPRPRTSPLSTTSSGTLGRLLRQAGDNVHRQYTGTGSGNN